MLALDFLKILNFNIPYKVKVNTKIFVHYIYMVCSNKCFVGFIMFKI